MKYYSRMSLLALLAVIPFNGFSQEREVPIKYGDMEQWVTRKIHESSMKAASGGQKEWKRIWFNP